jgi:hypothetical protein
MVKEIKIIDNENIEPENGLIILPLRDGKRYISLAEAENLKRILETQINLIKAGNVSQRSKGKYKSYSTRKTNSAT